MESEVGIQEVVFTSFVETDPEINSLEYIRVASSVIHQHAVDGKGKFRFVDIDGQKYFMEEASFNQPTKLSLVKPGIENFHETVHLFNFVPPISNAIVLISDNRELMTIQDYYKSNVIKFISTTNPTQINFTIDLRAYEQFRLGQNFLVQYCNVLTPLKLTNFHYYFSFNLTLQRIDVNSSELESFANIGEGEYLMEFDPMLKCHKTNHLFLFTHSYQLSGHVIIRRIVENETTNKAEVSHIENLLVNADFRDCSFAQLSENILFINQNCEKVMLRILCTKTLRLLPSWFKCQINKQNYFRRSPLVLHIRSHDYVLFDIVKYDDKLFWFEMAGICCNVFHALYIKSKTHFPCKLLCPQKIFRGTAIIGIRDIDKKGRGTELFRIIFK